MNFQTLSQSTPSVNYLSEVSHDTSPVAMALPSLSVIQVSGEEADSFLQNLLTNDIRTLTNNTAQLSGFCNPKGRLLSLFYVVKREKDFLLITATDLADSIAQRLTMFKLRSKVDISVSAELNTMGYISEAPLKDQASTFWSASEHDGQLSIYLPGNLHRYLVITPVDKSIIENSRIGSENLWQSADITSGLPKVSLLTKEQFTPQQLNLDVIGGVSFKKGCYPGQEVVARLHYLGKPSRRLFLAEITTSHLPEPNTEVIDEAGDVAGHVVQAAMNQADNGLCHLSIKLSAQAKSLYIGQDKISTLTALVDDPE
ncbi:MAG: hypothetical protein CMH22_15495 [Methylophaga sp.]|uniref:CAF17-like 4Fe-4S cluster assembly/insertion protein YgfZ n=1 Tax=Methylophaga sp. UBA678 TaxID=1946901 RepID=UPI000C64BFCB|nr:hypothetical protein [Methylophaga sp. UBA678]MAX53379.1 hypothetical protein [Methylophaga sp.]|tara:strand:+ start:47093 stop:48034 length:942 start_codon:yes stop_codon:yes gene_type:complete